MTKIEMHQRLQLLYKKMMGDLRPYAPVFCSNNNPIETLIDCHYCCPELMDKDCEHRIIIPLPIDPVNPERGLWGMVDWTKFKLDMFNGGKLEIYERRNGLVGELIVPETADPEEALLKALIEQENV